MAGLRSMIWNAWCAACAGGGGCSIEMRVGRVRHLRFRADCVGSVPRRVTRENGEGKEDKRDGLQEGKKQCEREEIRGAKSRLLSGEEGVEAGGGLANLEAGDDAARADTRIRDQRGERTSISAKACCVRVRRGAGDVAVRFSAAAAHIEKRTIMTCLREADKQQGMRQERMLGGCCCAAGQQVLGRRWVARVGATYPPVYSLCRMRVLPYHSASASARAEVFPHRKISNEHTRHTDRRAE